MLHLTLRTATWLILDRGNTTKHEMITIHGSCSTLPYDKPTTPLANTSKYPYSTDKSNTYVLPIYNNNHAQLYLCLFCSILNSFTETQSYSYIRALNM